MIVCKTNVLTEAQRRQVAALYAQVNTADGTQGAADMPAACAENGRAPVPCFYRGFEKEALIAFLAVQTPTQGKAQITAFVHPQHRRCGCFTMLLRMALADVEAQGVSTVLFVPQNAAAEAFLQKYEKQKSGEGIAVSAQKLLLANV